MAAVVGLVRLLGLGVPMAGLVILTGLAGLAWFPARRQPSGTAMTGQTWLVGLSLLGPAMLGLALTGLYMPVPMFALAISLAAGGWRRRGRIGFPRMESGLIWLALGAMPFVLLCLGPEMEQDSHIHHLALPAQWLLAHRAVFTAEPLTFRIPAPLEALWGLPLALGDDRLFAGIICDGIHVVRAGLRIAFRCKGRDRLMLVTDAMPLVGTNDRRFSLQERQITLHENRLTGPDGTLAGAHLTMI